MRVFANSVQANDGCEACRPLIPRLINVDADRTGSPAGPSQVGQTMTVGVLEWEPVAGASTIARRTCRPFGLLRSSGTTSVRQVIVESPTVSAGEHRRSNRVGV